jgi:hypothetical protein
MIRNAKGVCNPYLIEAQTEKLALHACAGFGEIVEIMPVHLEQLISYGLCECILGDAIEIGTVLMFHYGGRAKVTRVVSESKSFKTFEIESLDYDDLGRLHERKIKRDRWVPYDIEAAQEMPS